MPHDPAGSKARLPRWLAEELDGLAFALPTEFKEFGNGTCVLCLDIAVEMPGNAGMTAVRSIEPVCLLISEANANACPEVLLREDFPSSPHLTRRRLYGREWRHMCLTRRPKSDWWVGKTFRDAVRAIKIWLDDAAAGLLVKPDDPFEPLIADSENPVVEIDPSQVAAECAKHKNHWSTTAESVVPKRQTTPRFVVGKGTFPTSVWYQPSERDAAWIEQPRTVEDLVHFASRMGLNPKQFRYWVTQRGTHGPSLIVIGVRRPRQVLGRPDSDEWIAFDVVPSKSQAPEYWAVRSHLVRSRFTPELARVLSGLPKTNDPKKVILIGAGSLGSAVADMLIRSGIVHLRIIDSDVLQPHNLARHVLGQSDLGRWKAQALADQLNELFPGQSPVAESIVKDVLTFKPEEVEALLSGTDAIIDCSASAAVMRWLADVPHPGVPAIAIFQIDSGNATVLLAQGAAGGEPLDAVEVVAMSHWRNLPSVRSWLTDEQVAVDIGGGCRSASATIPWSLVLRGASWGARAIQLWLTCERGWPQIGVAGLDIVEQEDDDHLTATAHWENITFVSEESGGWRVHCCASVERELLSAACDVAPGSEDGGIMIGQIDRQRRVITIAEAWTAPPDSRPATGSFLRGCAKLRARLAGLEADTGDYLTYVGEWHTHPPRCGVDSSALDRQTMARLAAALKCDRVPALSTISDGISRGIHIFEHSPQTHPQEKEE